MKKLFLIIQREYFSRVKKKSFLIMTILGPLLMAGVFIVPIWLSLQDKTEHNVMVLDDSGLFVDKFENREKIKFFYSDSKIEEAQKQLSEDKFDAILQIPQEIINSDKAYAILSFKTQPGSFAEQYISNSIDNILFDYRLQGDSIDVQKIDKARRSVELRTLVVDKFGNNKKTSTDTNIFLGFMLAVIIYIMIFLYGAQVMRGVIEEKTNRIVEVIISSVKPFQLMLGKIIGIALVGLTQFILWIVLTLTISTVVTNVLFKDVIADQVKQNSQMEKVYKNDITAHPDKLEKVDTPSEAIQKLNNLQNINFGLIAGCFAFYFLFGYLLYAALFAAIGSAVDNDADTQQFMLPVTIPLILSFAVAQGVIANPNGAVAYWFSIIPLTSPVVMMVRLPFDVPVSDLITSMFLLVVGFFFFTWMAGKIYRTGILMYGKKASWKELGKWLFYKS